MQEIIHEDMSINKSSRLMRLPFESLVFVDVHHIDVTAEQL